MNCYAPRENAIEKVSRFLDTITKVVKKSPKYRKYESFFKSQVFFGILPHFLFILNYYEKKSLHISFIIRKLIYKQLAYVVFLT